VSSSNDPDHLVEHLFVYGSLRAEGSAHHLLLEAHREQDGSVAGFVRLKHNGYPMLRRSRDANAIVHGEVYAITADQWPALDRWEEVPSVYQRCKVQLRDGRMVWLYCEAKDPA